jgi:hypothetical protein
LAHIFGKPSQAKPSYPMVMQHEMKIRLSEIENCKFDYFEYDGHAQRYDVK